MTEKPYNLEERGEQFAKEVAIFYRSLPQSVSNIEYGKQVIRSSGSVGANYIEANDHIYPAACRGPLQEGLETLGFQNG